MGTMTIDEVMTELEKMGTAQNRKIYKRHGSHEPLFGVSFANLKILKKKIKVNHPLAEQLWATGNMDAQTLATMVADPKQMTEEAIEEWVKDTKYYCLVDLFAGNIAAKSAFAHSLLEKWTKSDDEWIGRAGWHVLAQLAMNDETLTDDDFSPYLETIEKDIHNRENRTREAMNMALIAVGSRNGALEPKAIKIAGIIGKVEVDHGETSCKTPDAAAYIKRTRARHAKKKA